MAPGTAGSILEHFSEADVALGVVARNKRALLEIVAEMAASRLGRPLQEILQPLEAREELGSTALDKGVALPHAQIPGLASPILLVARLDRPIDFDARDAEPVDLVFLVLWRPEDTKGLLNGMSEICRTVRDPALVRGLRISKTPQEVARLVRERAVRDPEDDGAGID